MIPSHESQFAPFADAVRKARTLFITAHVGPDGDTLGSMLAFRHAFLTAFPHIQRIDCVIAGKMPAVFRFLPGIQDVKDIETSPDILEHYDLAISVDCGSADRLGPSQKQFLNAALSVNIDHHISNVCFGQLNIVIPEAAASGEVVADILNFMQVPIPKEAAICLYTAILTDTGGFKYANTSPKVLRLVADLVEAGANPEVIFKAIYEDRPVVQVRLHADALQMASLNPGQTLAWTTVTREDLSRHQASDEHIEGIVEALRQIDSVLISCVFKETPEGQTKVSLRSDDHRLNVAEVMTRFQGGGHKMAAGCTFNLPPDEAEKVLLPILEKLIEEEVLQLQ